MVYESMRRRIALFSTEPGSKAVSGIFSSRRTGYGSAFRASASLVLASAIFIMGCDLNPNIEACSVTIAPTVITVPVNGRVPVTGTAFDCKGNSIRDKIIKYSTENPTIATVAPDGSVIGISVGMTTVSAVANKGTGTAQVTVTPEVAANVTVNPGVVTLRKGNTRTFTATVKNGSGIVITGRPVRWTSSNSSIASIDQNGVLIALAAGQVAVSAEVDQIVGSANVLITEVRIESCSVTPATNRILVGQQSQPTITLRDSAGMLLQLQGRPINWVSDNEIVAGVSQTGVITARKSGTAKITATSIEFPGVSCFTSVDVLDARVDKVLINQQPGFLRIGIPRLLTAQVLDSVNNSVPSKVVVWTSLTPAIASVSNLGIVTGTALGTARIRASVDGVSDSVTFQVTQIPVGSVTISPLQATVFEGQTAQFRATVKDSVGTEVTDRAVEWLTNDPTRATISSTGLAQAISSGVVQISAVSESRGGTSTLVILQVPVDTIIAPPSFTVVRGTTSGFTIVLRDANGNELRNRTVSVVSSQPNIAVVPANIQTSTVPVSGVAVGTTEITLRALNSNGQAEGKATKVTINVTLPPTGGNEQR